MRGHTRARGRISPADHTHYRWSPSLSTLLSLISIFIGVGLLFAASGPGHDGVFDWIIGQAALDGIDPYLPLSELALEYGAVLMNGGDEAGPRTPGAILLAVPLTLLPLSWAPTAARLLVVASAFAFAISLSHIAQIEWRWALPFVPLFLLLPPASHALYYGNASMTVAALLALALLPQADRWWAGMPLGVAVALRLWPGLIALVLLLVGRRRTALSAAVVTLLLNLAGLLLPGIELRRVVEGFMNSLGHVQNPANLSLVRLLPPSVIGLAVVAFLLWARRQEWRKAVSWSVPVALAASPVVWLHYLTVLMIPLAFAGRTARSSRNL